MAQSSPRLSDGPDGLSNHRQPSSPSMTPRKRASQACLACRARKVRCDVSLRGAPCMNCRMSGGDCKVVGRPTKYRTANNKEQRLGSDQLVQTHSVSLKAPSRPEDGHGMRETNISQMQTRPPIDPQNHEHMSSYDVDRLPPYLNGTTDGSLSSREHSSQSWETVQSSATHVRIEDEPRGLGGIFQDRCRGREPVQVDNLSYLLADHNKHPPSINSNANMLNGSLLTDICGILGAEQPQSTPTEFSRYSLIKCDDFSHSSSEDIEFLKTQGCFDIPAAPALDEFMRQYFTYVHPQLPMIDEAAFWEAFDGRARGHDLDFPISIFTFQAMLFACCSFVPLNVLRDVGFKLVHTARATLYRRAKLLFDFNGKRDLISTAQGALLLSYSPDTNNRKVNSYWLGIAVQTARDANAHTYDISPTMTDKERNVKKRLHWCCILRDRILPLGVRRPIYITSAHFDFKNNSPLNAKDLENEMGCSKVYDPKTKQSLAELIACLCELAVVLTSILAILFPVNDIPIALLGDAELLRSQIPIQHGLSDLNDWYENAIVRFPTPAGLGDTHESVILYTNLMYLYYHSARMALCHRELLGAKMDFRPQNGNLVQLHRSKAELQEASTSIIDIMKELLQLRLVKYLPISAVAFIALPLVLNILDVKLSLTKSQCATRQRRLQIFTEAMKILQSQYDGTARVSDAIERLIWYFAVNDGANSNDNPRIIGRGDIWDRESGAHSAIPGQRVTEWGDVLVRLPKCYLRIVITIDLALSRGEFPDEKDFPQSLQTSRLANSLPLYSFGQSQSIESTSGRDIPAHVFDKHDSNRDTESNIERGGSTTSHTTLPSHRKGTMDRRFQREAPPEAGFDEGRSHRAGFDDTPMDANTSRDLQLDTWMFDVLQDFSRD